MIGKTNIRLSNREKRTVIIGGIGILVLGIVFGWLLPSFDKIKQLDRMIVAEQDRLNKIKRLYGEFEAMNQRAEAVKKLIESRESGDFSIASVVENMARQTEILDRIQYLKPAFAPVSDVYREASVSLKATVVTPEQLVNFLYQIESSDLLLNVRSLQIRIHSQEEGKLDATMTVFTLLPAG